MGNPDGEGQKLCYTAEHKTAVAEATACVLLCNNYCTVGSVRTCAPPRALPSLCYFILPRLWASLRPAL